MLARIPECLRNIRQQGPFSKIDRDGRVKYFLSHGAAPSQLAVVVVSYNTRDLLLGCIASVFESMPSTTLELVVVENASNDGSCEALRQAFPQVVTIANATNRGFGVACNQAISITTAPPILLLNSDARLSPEGFGALWACMGHRPRCGAVGCRLIDTEGEGMAADQKFSHPVQPGLWADRPHQQASFPLPSENPSTRPRQRFSRLFRRLDRWILSDLETFCPR